MVRWFSFAVGAAWRALGNRVSAIAAVVTGTPRFINWISGYLCMQVIPNPWMWGTIAGLLVVVASLFWRIFQLEKIVIPKIEVAHDVDEMTDPASGPDRVVRFLRLEVRNPDPIQLDNCFVELEELINPDGSRGFFPPIGLITQDQMLEQGVVGPFRLRGGQRTLVHIATLDETVSDSEIELRYASKVWNKIPRTTWLKPYKIKLMAYGGGSPVKRRFFLYVDDTGRLTMRPIKEESDD